MSEIEDKQLIEIFGTADTKNLEYKSIDNLSPEEIDCGNVRDWRLNQGAFATKKETDKEFVIPFLSLRF